MNWLDWLVLLGTLAFIAIYGILKTRGQKDLGGYFKGTKTMPWWTIGLSVMATQASAITFMSTPGQAFEDGMRFVQFYFGLPLAMVILCVTFLPKFIGLNVYTAYEFLENRFDRKTRTLAALLFLVQRGLAAGITIYAPAIILSTILNWDLNLTIILIGLVVIAYTVGGGSEAVNQTQKQQMIVILVGMVIAFLVILNLLPKNVGFVDSLKIAGKMGRMNVVDFSFNLNDRYNFWSGITGGLFLALAYFGTDQSQVARYISGSSLTESRLGLIFNGLVKIPMQFGILLCGVMVYVFYLFNPAPIFFNESAYRQAENTIYLDSLQQQQQVYKQIQTEKSVALAGLVSGIKNGNNQQTSASQAEMKSISAKEDQLRDEVKQTIKKASPTAETKDTDYVFLTFVLNHMPHGIIGILLAVIFCAAMSSTSSEINALASTTVVDIFRWKENNKKTEAQLVLGSKWFTVLWGLLAIFFAIVSSLFDNLIEAVNILGSLFYGTILGIFLTAFYLKRIRGTAVFIGAIIAESAVVFMFYHFDIGFLWYNLIGCALVMCISIMLNPVIPDGSAKTV